MICVPYLWPYIVHKKWQTPDDNVIAKSARSSGSILRKHGFECPPKCDFSFSRPPKIRVNSEFKIRTKTVNAQIRQNRWGLKKCSPPLTSNINIFVLSKVCVLLVWICTTTVVNARIPVYNHTVYDESIFRMSNSLIVFQTVKLCI